MTARWFSSPSYRVARELIVAARNEAGMTQRALAERLGWHYTIIAKIERGDRRIDVVEFVAIARALGVDEPELTRRLSDRLGPTIEV